jgi:nitrite reductase/ring-hydroxylating ferredoxin subunit
MKQILFLLLIIPFAFSCDGGNINNNNPNIPNFPVNLQINLNLPANSNLQFPGNRIIDFSQGARGIVVFNTGSGFVAYDLACPNIAFDLCTTPMTIPPGAIDANCSCDDTVYSLYSGQSPGQPFPMKQYRVVQNGTVLTITN